MGRRETGERDVPYEKLIIVASSAWQRVKAHTVLLRPSRRASSLMTGNRAITGNTLATEMMYKRFAPIKSCSLPKSRICVRPLTMPHIERMKPIICGSSPRPPISTGVE